MTSRTNTRRNAIATLRATAAAAAAVLSCTLLLAGCTAGMPYTAPTTAVPLPSATGTWTPEPTTTEGPRTPAPLPTETAKIDEPVGFETGISVELASVKAASVTAETPGEVSGPAVVVSIRVTNDSTDSVNLDSAVVTLSADKGGYGVGTTAGSPKPLSGNLKPGASADGKYVFMLDPAKGRSVSISVNYGAGEPVAVFTGKTS